MCFSKFTRSINYMMHLNESANIIPKRALAHTRAGFAGLYQPSVSAASAPTKIRAERSAARALP